MGTRWDETDAPKGDAYDARWSQMAAAGQDIHGEADLVASVLEEVGGTRVLDAGCGTGRVAIELRRRGVEVVGVDADTTMLATARRNDPEIEWIHADLADLDTHLADELFDVVVLAGNVMIFLHPGTEETVIAQLSRHLRPGGRLVAGFALRPDRISLDDYDRYAAAAGLTPAGRWATWDRQPFGDDGYAVTAHQRVR
ncbi:methyltransferase domain-containing protein [Gordonia sp. SID5947]|uniref:class I SAM-dependent DNA methyltransferase n=1 Tax=Gordonia sp. SID5947 TaxID=2690315 RepID=UPI00136C7E44|nr:class I SAM-dependent methyltransferase [Gordonia sp. SID5947]MYR05452.1 methyltransferase domain-containing protein [Gordonia sp. SID5947]